MKILLLTSLLLGCSLFTFGQADTSGKAVIYVYAFKASGVIGNGLLKRPVFLDDKDIADITPMRYFIIEIGPGKYTVHFKDEKAGGIEKEFKAGEIYYLRVNWFVGAVHIQPSGIDLVAPEAATFDIKQMKPIDESHVHDKQRVFLKL